MPLQEAGRFPQRQDTAHGNGRNRAHAEKRKEVMERIMAYVSIPKDLDRIQNRIVFNLTLRQLVCLGVAGAVGIPAYFMAKDAVGTSGASVLMTVLMLPAFCFAMYEKDGLPLEGVLLNILKVKYLRPAERPYWGVNGRDAQEQEEPAENGEALPQEAGSIYDGEETSGMLPVIVEPEGEGDRSLPVIPEPEEEDSRKEDIRKEKPEPLRVSFLPVLGTDGGSKAEPGTSFYRTDAEDQPVSEDIIIRDINKTLGFTGRGNGEKTIEDGLEPDGAQAFGLEPDGAHASGMEADETHASGQEEEAVPSGLAVPDGAPGRDGTQDAFYVAGLEGCGYRGMPSFLQEFAQAGNQMKDRLPDETDGLLEEAEGLPEEAEGLPKEEDGLPDETDGLLEEQKGLPGEENEILEEAERLPKEENGLLEEAEGLPKEEDGLPGETDAFMDGRTGFVPGQDPFSGRCPNEEKTGAPSYEDYLDGLLGGMGGCG